MHFTKTLVLAIASVASAQKMAVDIIKEIAPKSASCAEKDECRTAEQIAPLYIAAFVKYGIYSYPEMAAVIALCAYESVEFQYKRNKSPGRPGQGTSNMQMIDFNLQFALSIPELKDKAEQLAGGKAAAAIPDDAQRQIQSLVIDDQYNFQTGPWYLTSQTKCNGVREKLRANPDAGWDSYMNDCVGVGGSDVEGRKAYFTAAKKAFGI